MYQFWRRWMKITKKHIILIVVFLTIVLICAYFSFSEDTSQEFPHIDEFKSRSADNTPVEYKRNNKPYIIGNDVKRKNSTSSEKLSQDSFVPKGATRLPALPSEKHQERHTYTELYKAKSKKIIPKDYAPYGRLIPCKTVFTIDSVNVKTPVIALVTEDVFHNGNLIIPAGTEVHGKASTNPQRETIEAEGAWNFVFRDSEKSNGVELTLQGIALNRSYDYETKKWGLDDGSAGIKGYVVKSNSYQEVKLFVASFLSSFTSALKDTESVSNEFGGISEQAKATTKNASLAGTSTLLEMYASRILREIEENGFYVHVPSGTQFYVYVTQSINMANASIGNESVTQVWEENNENDY